MGTAIGGQVCERVDHVAARHRVDSTAAPDEGEGRAGCPFVMAGSEEVVLQPRGIGIPAGQTLFFSFGLGWTVYRHQGVLRLG